MFHYQPCCIEQLVCVGLFNRFLHLYLLLPFRIKPTIIECLTLPDSAVPPGIHTMFVVAANPTYTPFSASTFLVSATLTTDTIYETITRSSSAMASSNSWSTSSVVPSTLSVFGFLFHVNNRSEFFQCQFKQLHQLEESIEHGSKYYV